MPRPGRTPIPVPLDEVVRLYREGATTQEIGQRFGVSPQTVGRRLTKAGVPLRRPSDWLSGPKPALQKVTDDQIRELADGRRTAQEIGDLLGVGSECVRRRMVRLGIPRLAAKARPEHNTFWRGGRTVDKDGYVLVKAPGHPHCTKAGYVREHRLVVEATLGRFLLPSEVVDHIDGDPQNNDPSNLRVFASNAEHLRATLSGRPQRSRNPRRSRAGDATPPG